MVSVNRDFPKWYMIALGEMGQKEIPGSQHNPRIVMYHSTTGLSATTDEVPWCSSFVNWCFRECGYKYTKSATARSWLTWGNEMMDAYPGCVVILKRGNSDTAGHVGFYVEEDSKDPNRIIVLGGNQSDKVCEMSFSKDDVLGYRWPKEI